MKKLLLTTILILLLPIRAWAATYYVSQAGAGGETGTDCANAKSITWFNSNAVAGDTAILCDGTYTTSIIPSNSGTSGNHIIYIADNQYGAVITTSSYGSNLTGKDYITIDGLYFNDTGGKWIYIDGSDYNIVQNCKFYDAGGGTYSGIYLGSGSQYNKFLDNIFEDAPDSGDANGTAPADFIQIGQGCTTCSYNVFEGNTFGKVGHFCLLLHDGTYNVIRNNTFSNTYHAGLGPGANALVENNYFYDMGSDWANTPGVDDWPSWFWYRYMNGALQLNGANNIIRNNIFDDNGYSIFIASTNGDWDADDNRIYHNTMNKAVRVIRGGNSAGQNFENNMLKNNIISNPFDTIATDGETYGTAYNIYIETFGGTGNKWYKNNLYNQDWNKYQITSAVYGTLSTIQTAFTSDFPGATNLNQDPKYTNATNRDFTLQNDSPMIDAATNLTLTTNTGEGGTAVVTVADSWYFYDGWGIADEVGDYIYIEDTGKVQILSVDSATQITLTANATWGTGKKVYHCPGGVCFSGSAPDIGANEYGGTPQNQPPTITNVQPGNTDIYADGGAGWNEISCSSTISDVDSETYYITWDFGIEYLVDGDMEDDPANNWTSNNATLAVETEIKRTGTNSLKVIDTGDYGCAYQTITTEIGAKYRFEAYGYLPSELDLYDTLVSVGTTLTNQDLGYAYITAEDVWTYAHVDFVATATTTYVAMEVRGNSEDSSDWAFWDDVRVRQISIVEDPGTITFPDPGSYPTAYTVTINATDDLGAAATQQSFIVTIKETSVAAANVFTGRANALWKFDNGALITDSIGVYTLTDNGTVDTDTTNEMEGDACADFDRTVPEWFDRAGTVDDFGIATSGLFTICGWVRSSELTPDQCIIRKGSTFTTDCAYALEILANDTVGGYIGYNAGASWETFSHGNALTVNQWYHVCWAYNVSTKAQRIRLWGNTEDAIIGTDYTTATTNTMSGHDEAGTISIGAWGSGGLAYAGLIDELVVMDEFLSVDEMDAVRSQQFPLAIIGEIVGVSANGTYGVDDSITVAVKFTHNGNPVSVTWTDGGTDSSLTATPDVGAAMTLTHTFPASGVAATTHEFTGTVVAGQTEDDLDISAFNIEQGAFTYGSPAINCAVTLPSSPNRLQDNAAIIIDTTSPDFSLGAFFHCNSSKVQINEETTYTAGQVCYLCVQSDGDAIFFNYGPLVNLKIGTDMAYPALVDFDLITGIGTNILQFARVIQIGDRDLDLQAEGTAENTGLIHGATKLIDAASNEVVYALPQADPAGGNIIIAASYPSTGPHEFDNANTMVAWITAGAYPVPDDFFEAIEANSIGTVDLSGSDGTSGHPITIDGGGFADDGVQTWGDYYTVSRIINGLQTTLGLGNIDKYDLYTVDSTLYVPEGATGCVINDDSIRGTLSLAESVDVYNTWVTTVDLSAIETGETAEFYNSAFLQSQATIEATLGVGGAVNFTDCLFEIATSNFRNYTDEDYHLTAGSALTDAGYNTGADIDVEGKTVPIGSGYDIGAYEYYPSGARPMGMSMKLKGGFCPHRPED